MGEVLLLFPAKNSSSSWLASRTSNTLYGYMAHENFEATHGSYWSDVTLEETNLLAGNSASILRYFTVAEDLQGIYNTYLDIGQSGSKESRPEFDKLIADMRSGFFKGVLVYKLDRIGRSLQHLINLFEEFRHKGIEFISATQNINTTTPTALQ